MLGPVSESVFGEQDLLALNLLAIARFPGFAAELEKRDRPRHRACAPRAPSRSPSTRAITTGSNG